MPITRTDPTTKEQTSTFDGAVLEMFERNGYHDSDFYAIVYDADTDDLKTIEYASTRGVSYSYAKVDATPEIVELARAASFRRALHLIEMDEQYKSEKVAVGKTVRLTSDFNGRKQPSAKAGEEAQVNGIYEDTYNPGWQGRVNYKARVDFADGRTITLPVDRFEVVDPDQYFPGGQEMEQRAARWAQGNFRSITEGGLSLAMSR